MSKEKDSAPYNRTVRAGVGKALKWASTLTARQCIAGKLPESVRTRCDSLGCVVHGRLQFVY
jgi:hypothetical protein